MAAPLFDFSGRQRQSLRLLPLGVLESLDIRNQVVKVPDTDGTCVVLALMFNQGAVLLEH